VGKAAGKWTDAATAEHGDLLDVIRQSCGLVEFGVVLAEAHRFLSLPRPERGADSASPIAPAPVGSPESARRLFAMSKPIHGTIAETYLRTRGISALHETLSLRFHLRCYYKPATSRRRCRHSRDHDRHVTLAHGGDRGGAHPHTFFFVPVMAQGQRAARGIVACGTMARWSEAKIREELRQTSAI
jgi:hypothetical protein